MGRIARTDLLYDGCYAHVFTRAVEKRKIFSGAESFRKFKILMVDSKKKYKYKVYHYCIMSTHFHIVVKIDDVQLFTRGLGCMKKVYSEWYNFKNKRFGPVWRDRYKSLLIEDENYLSACGQYVEENPVKAGMVQVVEDWKYSSARHYLGLVKDELVDEYERPEKVSIKQEEIEFTKGLGIGSGYFRFDLKESLNKR